MPWKNTDALEHKKGLTEKQCLICGEAYEPTSGSQLYCIKCKKLPNKIAVRNMNRVYAGKKCTHCGENYIPLTGNQLVCGECEYYCDVCGKKISKGNNLCRSCWQLGDRNNARMVDVRVKLSEASRVNGPNKGMLGKHPSLEVRKIMSAQRTGSKNSNFGKVTYGTGKCKWYDYESPIAGFVRLQGTYELRMAKVLDRLGWEWGKNKDHFIYDNGNHSYIPDFKITKRGNEECLYYIDTKGYFSKYDQSKMYKVREENPSFIVIILCLDILEQYERMVNYAVAS